MREETSRELPRRIAAFASQRGMTRGDTAKLGTGIATWNTETLGTWLDHQSEDSDPL